MKNRKLIEYWGSHNFQKLDRDSTLFRLLKQIRSSLGVKSRILEIGCGNGRYLKLFRDYNPTGIDISPKNVERTRNRGLHAVRGDARNLQFKNNSFDFVFSLGVVEHFPETEQAIKEHARVCKPGGLILISVPNKISINYLEMKIINTLRGLSIEEQMVRFGKRYSSLGLKRMCSKAGIKNIKINYTGQIFAPFPRGLNRFIQRPEFLKHDVVCLGEK